MSGHVRIGAFETLTVSFLPGFMAHVHERFPKLTIAITSGTLDSLSEMLLDRRVHLAISTTPKQRRGIVLEELFRDHYRFYMARGAAASKRASSTLPLIIVPEAADDAGRTVPEYVSVAASRRRSTMALSTFEAVRAFALEGIGIAVLPTLCARGDVARGRLREVQVPGAPSGGFGEHRIVAQWHERERSDMRLSRLVDEMKRHVNPVS
jgi:DNA-binding transcriptional LysR family regulator